MVTKVEKDYYQHELEMINLSLPLPFATLYQRKHQSQGIISNKQPMEMISYKQYTV